MSASSLTYLDTSVAIYNYVNTPAHDRVRSFLLDNSRNFVSSRLLKTELIRTLRRDDKPVSAAVPLLQRVALIAISEQVHLQAEMFTAHVRSLDALHLATAVLLGGDVTLASHDARMLQLAADLGLQTLDPVVE